VKDLISNKSTWTHDSVTASENACQKPAGNSRRLKTKRCADSYLTQQAVSCDAAKHFAASAADNCTKITNINLFLRFVANN